MNCPKIIYNSLRQVHILSQKNLVNIFILFLSILIILPQVGLSFTSSFSPLKSAD